MQCKISLQQTLSKRREQGVFELRTMKQLNYNSIQSYCKLLKGEDNQII